MKRLFTILLMFWSVSTFAQGAWVDSLSRLLPNLKPDTSRVNILIILANEIILQDKPQAERYADEAIKLSDKLGFKTGLIDAWRCKAIIANMKRELDKAIIYYSEALSRSVQINDHYRRGRILTEIGEIYTRKGDISQSLDYHYQALAIGEKYKNKDLQCLAYNNIGATYVRKGDYEEAEKALNKASNLVKRLGSKEHEITNYQNFTELYEAKGDIKQALIYHKKYVTLKDSIFSKAKENELFRKEYELQQMLLMTELLKERKHLVEAEKREKENELLIAENKLKESIIEQQKLEEQKILLEKQKEEKELDNMRKNAEIQRKALYFETLVLYASIITLLFVITFAIFLYRESIKQRKTNTMLVFQNEKISQQKDEIVIINSALEEQKRIIQEKNEQMQDSIKSAQSVQTALLPNVQILKQCFESFCVLYKPRDIVSGDFYWYNQITHNGHQKTLIAAVDCTGHGVHGAFISILGSNLLDKIVISEGIVSPELILERLHAQVVETLRQDENSNSDGMDISLCVIDKQSKTIEYAGAKNPIFYIQKGEIFEIKPTSRHIGGMLGTNKNPKPFEKQIISFAEPLTFYMFSDGYSDQLNDEVPRKKLGKVQFQKLLLQSYQLSPENQVAYLENALNQWRKTSPQIDDILVMGIKL